MLGLLSDVADGLVDIVVVHRLDRLTRHMGDFSALMQDFECYGVALVSVTQSIDTSGPQGHLTLNLLTSFAQFEREMSAFFAPPTASMKPTLTFLTKKTHKTDLDTVKACFMIQLTS